MTRSPNSTPPPPTNRDPLPEQVGRKAKRKLRARAGGRPNLWFGLGLIGIIGWTVALPPVVGALLGVWLDRNWPSRHSWALTLLIIGLALGCVTAWQWLRNQDHD